MKTQLITIDPFGGAESLQFKGTGVDLREMGSVEIQRVSDVVFDSALQRWTVKLLLGEKAGLPLTAHMVEKARSHAEAEGIPFTPFSFEKRGRRSLATFQEYDDAVAAEVLVIQWARLTGAFAI